MLKDSPNLVTPRTQILELCGDHARSFASNQLASRIDQLDSGRWQWTAWLDASGKVRFVGMLWLDGDCLRMILRGGDVHAIREDLARYVLRSKLTITADDTAHLRPGAALPHGQLQRSPEEIAFGLGDYSLILASHAAATDTDEWQDCTGQAIAAGHPWLPDSALNSLLPPALGLYRLGAVALGKGCYPGQEMVNRLHHRGGHKYAMAHVHSELDWTSGQDLRNGQQSIGTVLQRAGVDALIVIRDGALDKLQNTSLIRKFPA